MVDKSGLITVRQKQPDGSLAQTIVVPTGMFPGLVNALHIKTSHPSKLQLTKLLARHFYCPGQTKVISDITDKCHTCLSLKQLPSQLFPEMTTSVEGFGCNFSADVMVRMKQKIIVIREKMSQFVFARLIQDETSDTLANAIIPLISDLVPESGATIRTDNAPAFIKLNSESKLENSIFKASNIVLELGDTLNQNKNPVAENAIKELQKEFLRLGFSNKHLEPINLALAVKNINSRIRERGFSSKEICFKRSQTTNENIKLNDAKLILTQEKLRETRHNDVIENSKCFSVGDLVILRDKLSKHEARQTFVIVELMTIKNIPYALIQKFNDKFMSRQYRVPTAKLILLPRDGHPSPTISDVSNSRPKRKAAIDARDKIKVSVSLCQTQIKEVKPLHSWDYDQFLADLENDDLIYTTIHHAVDEIGSDDDFTSAEDDQELNSDSSQTMSMSESIHGSESNLQTLAHHLQDPEVYEEVSPVLDEMIADMRRFNSQHPKPRARLFPSSHSRHPDTDQVDLGSVQHLDRAVQQVPLDLMAAQEVGHALDALQPQLQSRPRRQTREVIDYSEFNRSGKKK